MNPTNQQKADAKSDTDHIANPPVLNPATPDRAGPNDTVQGKPKNVPGEPVKQEIHETVGGPDPLQVITKNPEQSTKLNQDFAQNRTDDDKPGIQGTKQG